MRPGPSRPRRAATAIECTRAIPANVGDVARAGQDSDDSPGARRRRLLTVDIPPAGLAVWGRKGDGDIAHVPTDAFELHGVKRF